MLKFTSGVVILVAIFTSSLLAQSSPSAAVDLVVYAQAVYYNHTSHIARTSDDKLVIAWTAPGDITQIVASTYDADFQTWSPPVAVSSAPEGEDAHKVGIAADDNGNVYAAWQQGGTWTIYFSKFDGNSWSTPVDISNNGLDNQEASIIVNSEGAIFVVWNTDEETSGSQWILCRRSSDGGDNWSTPDTLSSSDGILKGSSIEKARAYLGAGQNGKVVCSWFEVPEDGVDEEIMINQFDGQNWSGEKLVTDYLDGIDYRYSPPALDQSDNIYVVYRPNLSSDPLVMKKKGWSDAEWPADADTIVATDFNAIRPFISTDDDDNLYVVFRANMPDDTTGLEQIAYVTSGDGGTTWSEPVQLSRPGYDAGYVSSVLKVRTGGVDVLWREGHFPMQEDPDSLALLYGRIELLGTAIGDAQPIVINGYRLEQNFPNPFNPATEIRYEIAVPGRYEMSVFNLLGQKVITLFSGEQKPGVHRISWNGINHSGYNVGTGVYFYKLTGKGVNLTRKMVLMR